MTNESSKSNSNSALAKQASEIETAVEYWIDYVAAAELVSTKHANELVVQTYKDEIFLSFFLMSPPTMLGTPQEQEKYKDKNSLQPECVAKINMSPDLLKRTIKVLQENLDRYEASKEQSDGAG